MSDAYARYSFLPWVRQGLARYLDTADSGQSNAAASVSLPVQLRVNDLAPISRDVTLLGPGDVVGVEPTQIIRRDPERQSKSAAVNMFPSVEFRSPDLPWLFTPLKPDTSHRLRPWLCLVVVRQQDGVTLQPGIRGAPPRLTIAAPADPARELPPLSESWAWAHCQVTLRADDERPVRRIMAESPELAISRLVCPRRLSPLTAYHACLVPTFRVGANAALGLPPLGDLEPAWDQNAPVTLPVYDAWEFTTGPANDFEALVRLLKPMPLPPGLGERAVDLSRPNWGDPAEFGVDAAADRLPATFEGALRAPDQERVALPDAVATAYPAKLAQILADAQAPADDGDPDPDPVVAPPLYGRWHSRRSAGDIAGHWTGELNLDPRDRAAAGLGTAAVRMHQEALMHSAWEQVDGIVAANNLLRRGKMAEAVGTAFKARHLDTMTAAEVLSLTYPIHAQLLMSPITLREKIDRSVLPNRSFSPSLRRNLRPEGPIARNARLRTAGVAPQALLDGRLKAAEDHAGFAGMVTPKDLAQATLGTPLQRWLYRLLAERGAGLGAAAIALALLAIQLAGPLAVAVFSAAGLACAVGLYALANRGLWARARLLTIGGQAPEALATLRPPEDFAVALDRAAPDGAAPPVTPEVAAARVTEFRAAAIARREAVRAQLPKPPPPADPLSVSETHVTVMLRLDPSRLARARFADRLTRPPANQPADPLDEVMASPVFDTPMYQTLRDQNQDYVLPGLQSLPTNSVTIAEVNRRFLEAFMVGANHEMARELRWREYPTDQRGTYFRRFWDARGGAGAASPGHITAIDRWDDSAPLGRAGLPDGSEPEKLVLVVRGELLRRFPTAQIYAQRAQFQAKGNRTLDAEIRQPLFRGSLPPDVQFIGFDFDKDEALGSTHMDQNRPGWFIVIQQQPTEPRFGLDVAAGFAPELGPLTSWDNLSWGHFAQNAEDLAGLGHLSPNDPPDTGGSVGPGGVAWGRDAAGIAYATLQKPVRIAIHADDMLPPEPADDPT